MVEARGGEDGQPQAVWDHANTPGNETDPVRTPPDHGHANHTQGTLSPALEPPAENRREGDGEQEDGRKPGSKLRGQAVRIASRRAASTGTSSRRAAWRRRGRRHPEPLAGSERRRRSPGYGALRGQVFGRSDRREVAFGLRHCGRGLELSSGLGLKASEGTRFLTGHLVDLLHRRLVLQGTVFSSSHSARTTAEVNGRGQRRAGR